MVYNLKKALMNSKEEKEIRKHLPQAIYQTASMVTFADYEETVKAVAESGYGALSKEFEKISKSIKNNGFESSMKQAINRTNSKELREFLEILLTGYETGEDIHNALIKTADSILSKKVIEEQQAASTLIQKYTIILSSAFIVPMLLGVVVSLVKGINMAGLFEISAQLKKEALSLMITADYAYVAANYLISTVFAAVLGNEKNLLKYLPLVIIPIAVFTLAKGIRIL